MEWRVQIISVRILLLLGGVLQFTWADKNGTVSNCLPMEGLTEFGYYFFSTSIPFYGVVPQFSDVRANYSTVVICTLTVALNHFNLLC